MATNTYSRNPAHNQVTRRGLIVSALLAPAAASYASASSVGTPVMRAFAEWRAITATMGSPEAPISELAFEAMVVKRLAIERAMFAIPCEAASDSILKLLAYTDMGEDFVDDDFSTGTALLKEAAALIGELV